MAQKMVQVLVKTCRMEIQLHVQFPLQTTHPRTRFVSILAPKMVQKLGRKMAPTTVHATIFDHFRTIFWNRLGTILWRNIVAATIRSRVALARIPGAPNRGFFFEVFFRANFFGPQLFLRALPNAWHGF